MPRERIIIEDDLYGRIDVQREPAPLLALMPPFVPMGAGRGEWERARNRSAIPPAAGESSVCATNKEAQAEGIAFLAQLAPETYMRFMGAAGRCYLFLANPSNRSGGLDPIDLKWFGEMVDILSSGPEPVSANPDLDSPKWTSMQSNAIKHRVELAGKIGFIYEYPNGRCWARLETGDKKLGSFDSFDAASNAVIEALA